MSRNKGAVAEREVAKIIADRLGIDTRRTPLSGGMEWKGDIRDVSESALLNQYHFEIKRQERLLIPAWTRQAEDDAPSGTTPLVVFRQSREPWRAIIPFDALLDLIDVSLPAQRT